MARKPKADEKDTTILDSEQSLEETAQLAERLGKNVADNLTKYYEASATKLAKSLEKNLSPLEKAISELGEELEDSTKRRDDGGGSGIGSSLLDSFKSSGSKSDSGGSESSMWQNFKTNMVKNTGKGKKFDPDTKSLLLDIGKQVVKFIGDAINIRYIKPMKDAISDMGNSYESNFNAISGAMGTHRKETHNIMESAVDQLADSTFSGAVNANKELIPELTKVAQEGFKGDKAIELALSNAVDRKIMPWLDTNSEAFANLQANLHTDQLNTFKAQQLILQETQSGNRLLQNGVINSMLNDLAPVLTNIEFNTGGKEQLSAEGQALMESYVDQGMTPQEAYAAVKKYIDIYKDPTKGFDSGNAADVMAATAAYQGGGLKDIATSVDGLMSQAAAAGNNAGFVLHGTGADAYVASGVMRAEGAQQMVNAHDDGKLDNLTNKFLAADAAKYEKEVDSAEEHVSATQDHDNKIQNDISSLVYDVNQIAHGVDMLESLVDSVKGILGSIFSYLTGKLVSKFAGGLGSKLFNKFAGTKMGKWLVGKLEGSNLGKKILKKFGYEGKGTKASKTGSKAAEAAGDAADTAKTAKKGSKAAEAADDAADTAKASKKGSKAASAADDAADGKKALGAADDAAKTADAAGDASKTGSKVASAADDAKDAVKAADKASDAAKAVDVAGDAAKAVDTGSDIASTAGKVAGKYGDDVVEVAGKAATKTAGKTAAKTAAKAGGKFASKAVPIAGDIYQVVDGAASAKKAFDSGKTGAGVAYSIESLMGGVSGVLDATGVGVPFGYIANGVGLFAGAVGNELSMDWKESSVMQRDVEKDTSDKVHAVSEAAASDIQAVSQVMDEEIAMRKRLASEAYAVFKDQNASEEELQAARQKLIDAGVVGQNEAAQMSASSLMQLSDAFVKASGKFDGKSKELLGKLAEDAKQKQDNQIDSGLKGIQKSLAGEYNANTGGSIEGSLIHSTVFKSDDLKKSLDSAKADLARMEKEAESTPEILSSAEYQETLSNVGMLSGAYEKAQNREKNLFDKGNMVMYKKVSTGSGEYSMTKDEISKINAQLESLKPMVESSGSDQAKEWYNTLWKNWNKENGYYDFNTADDLISELEHASSLDAKDMNAYGSKYAEDYKKVEAVDKNRAQEIASAAMAAAIQVEAAQSDATITSNRFNSIKSAFSSLKELKLTDKEKKHIEATYSIKSAFDKISKSKDPPGNDKWESIPKYKTGTDWVPEDQLAYLHEGEAVLTKDENLERLSDLNASVQDLQQRSSGSTSSASVTEIVQAILNASKSNNALLEAILNAIPGGSDAYSTMRQLSRVEDTVTGMTPVTANHKAIYSS